MPIHYEEKDVAGKENMDLLKSVNLKKYETIGLDPLLMYVLGQMEEHNIRLSFPNITVAMARLFPHKFSLFGWVGVPDSSRASTTLWHLKDKDKRWITGTNNQYVITKKGWQAYEESKEILKTPSKRKNKRENYSKTLKYDKLLKQMKEKAAFKKYQAGEEITQFDLYDMLQCTLDSSTDVLKENYDALYVLATEAKSSEMIDFLRLIKNKFKEIRNA